MGFYYVTDKTHMVSCFLKDYTVTETMTANRANEACLRAVIVHHLEASSSHCSHHRSGKLSPEGMVLCSSAQKGM